MKKKFLGRVLTMLLVASMVFTLLPAPAIAAGNWWWNNDEYTEEAVPTATTTADANYHYNIFFLDCGRKYYSVDSIKQLINNASAAGFNYIQLAVGNDGLRFLLNDMSLTVNGTTYSSQQVSAAIHKGNETYYNFPVDELTESEMNDIIAYANTKGMGVIPCVNTPGHMDAILSAAKSLTGTTCSYNGSARTIDVTNPTAIAFTQALLQKYITYFKSQSCQLFNMGADEYANDIYTGGSMGFGNLQTSGKYSYYVNYVNQVAKMIKDAGMKPMTFNDGIYYGSNTSSGKFDTDIIICYWSAGWSGYDPMSAAALANKGFKLVNTNGAYYWVLGKTDAQCDANKAANFSYLDFPRKEGQSNVNESAGSMFCIWADYPGAESEASVISKTAATIAAFKGVLPTSTPDTTTPTPPETGTTPPEPITITVGDTATEMINGHVYDADVKTEGSSAEWALDRKTETTPGGDQPVSGDKLSSTFFYIKRSDGKYFTKDSTWEDNIENAAQYQTVQQYGGNTYQLKLMRSRDSFIHGYESNAWLTSKSSATNYSFDGEFYYTTRIFFGGTTRYTLGTPVVQTEGETKDYTLVTFTGKSEGTTYVTIGNVKYTINVVPKELNNVEPLSIEYWITNSRVKDKDTSATEKKISAAEVYNVNGCAITDFVSNNAVKADISEAKMLFWKATRLTNGNYQTAENGIDKTMAGDDFSYIRYWDSQWEFSANGTNWTAFNSTDQVVAYYMQVTEVTDEVTTTVVDWGEPRKNFDSLNYLGGQFVLLDFAVKYESGDCLPSTFPTKNTIGFHCANMPQRTLGRINAIPSNEYEVYMITLTPSNDDASVVLSGSSAQNAASKEYKYQGTEKVVWVDKAEDLGQFTDKSLQHSDFTVGGEATLAKGVTINKGQGMLVTYYLRTKVTEDSLTVNYVDLDNTSEPFYSYKIAVKSGTTFRSDIQLANPAEQDLLNGDVVNIKGKTQTVTADLTKMNGVPAAYRYASEITCKRMERSEDGKVLTLYYTFDNSVSFIADFGLPLTIKANDLSDAFGDGSRIEQKSVTREPKHGTVAFTGNKGIDIIYTPGNTFPSSSGDSFTVTYTGKNPTDGKEGSASFVIYILPASNVLYEENFLTQSGESGLSWTKGTTVAPTTPQQTQKAKANGNVFGYDAAYNAVTGELGVWKLGSEQNPLQDNTFYASCLTTEFYGNGFDLIGNCGPTTGRVSVLIAGKNGGYIYDVDTRYNDGKNTTLYQVPLMHIDLHDEGIYTVKVYGSGLAKTTVSPASYSLSGAATYASDYAVGGYDTVLSDILAENGLTMADVEYVKVESAPAATTRSAASFYALDTAAETGTVTHEAGKHVEIDGFRVYRSTDNDNYPANEKNVTYENILDVVDRKFVAYTETNGNFNATVETYEAAGGPQNEIYLGKDQAVTFAIENVNSIQVSLRAVNGTAKWNGYDITSNTEMYYELTAENGVFTIANSGDNLLAIGNVKIPGNAGGIQTASELPADVVLASVRMALGASGEGDTFDPAISAKVTTTRFIRSKVVTLTVSASADVEKLMVNGVELRPTNSWLVKMGWSDTYTYILTEKVQKNEIKTYEIVGYRADGAASAPIVVESK